MEQSRSERHFKRLWTVIIVLLAMLFATNIGWLIYESQFEYVGYDYTQDGEGTNIIGNGNEVLNGATTDFEIQEEEKPNS